MVKATAGADGEARVAHAEIGGLHHQPCLARTDGQYVVVYESSFEHKKSAIEAVTPSLDKDGQWKVSGYFIR